MVLIEFKYFEVASSVSSEDFKIFVVIKVIIESITNEINTSYNINDIR